MPDRNKGTIRTGSFFRSLSIFPPFRQSTLRVGRAKRGTSSFQSAARLMIVSVGIVKAILLGERDGLNYGLDLICSYIEVFQRFFSVE